MAEEGVEKNDQRQEEKQRRDAIVTKNYTRAHK